MANQIFIHPDPFVKWNFKARTTAKKNEKIALANAFLGFYLQGYQKALRKLNVRLRFNVDVQVVPNGNRGFTFIARVRRKPLVAGDPETGKDPARPTPPPPL